MRKILLASTALVAFAGAAQAAESPIQVTLGGSVDFRAALFHESDKVMATGETVRRNGDFQSEYDLTIAATGKAAGGIDYGALINLDNGQARVGTDQYGVAAQYAYVWMSGAFGKVLMGDERGASDLFVMAPTVGEGQIAGNYTNFTDANTLAEFKPTFFSNTESYTKVTYYTPKVGNANHKVQLGVSYAAENEQGTVSSSYEPTTAGGYENLVETVVQYTGDFKPVSVTVSPMLIVGEGQGDKASLTVRDFTAWGVGADAKYAAFTLGGSYVDAGHMTTTMGQEENQDVWTIGLKYTGFDKVELAANYMDGEGYFNVLDGADSVYVDSFSAVGLGATYTWFPGLTTAADAVFFDQSRKDATSDNVGQVLMLTQKMSF
ncbi:MAG: porin [Bdellovibrionales bacterium]|jgi:hypothetical protein